MTLSETERRVASDPELVKLALAVLMDEVADELWFCDREGNLAMANKAAVTAFGFTSADEVVQPMTDWLAGLKIFHVDGRSRLPEDAPLLRSLRGEIITDFEELVRHPQTGRMHFREVYSTPIRNAKGEIVGSVAVVRDITERRELEERQKVLVAELQHRVKNILANVQAIVSRIFARHGPAPDIERALRSRLHALARTQDVLTAKGAQCADMGDLLSEELRFAPVDNADISGPSVSLEPNSAQFVGMAFHEMVTNSSKYGVGQHGGRLEVRWKVEKSDDAKENVRLEWNESLPDGVHLDVDGCEPGFGTEFIERALPYSLRGTSELKLTPSGMRWRLDFPMRH